MVTLKRKSSPEYDKKFKKQNTYVQLKIPGTYTDYRVGDVINKGSHSKVFKILDKNGSAYVAKLILYKKNSNNTFKEYNLLKLVTRHNNVVSLIDSFQNKDKFYMIQEFLPFQLEVPVSHSALAKKFLVQLCGAIDFIHKRGIIHADIKLRNMLLDYNNNLVLIDFGHSFFNNQLPKELFGTGHYMAPETVDCYVRKNPFYEVSYEIDIWAIGIVLFLMIFGFTPFESDTFELLCDSITRKEIDWDALDVEVNTDLKDLIANILQKTPFARLSIPEIVMHRWVTEDFHGNFLACANNAGLVDKHDTPNEQLDMLNKSGLQQRQVRLEKLQSTRRIAVLNTNEIRYALPLRILRSHSLALYESLHENLFSIQRQYATNIANIPTPIFINHFNFNPTDNISVAYQLSSGHIGTIFKHGHSILRSIKENSLWYICPDENLGWVSKYFAIDMVPQLLKDRFTEFEAITNTSTLNPTLSLPNIGSDESATFLRRFVDYEDVTLMELSNGTFQYNFKNTASIICFSHNNKYATILENGCSTTIPVVQFLKEQHPTPRLKLILSLLKQNIM